jgi:predicted kinase
MAPKTDICISRDNIRFGLLGDEEDYFAHEDEVRKIFSHAIQEKTSSNKWENIYIDATHLSPKARKWTMWNISKYCYVIAVSLEVPVELAAERNKQRTGRALVPDSVIRNMSAQYVIPTLKEGFDEIWHVNAEGKIVKEVKNNE